MGGSCGRGYSHDRVELGGVVVLKEPLCGSAIGRSVACGWLEGRPRRRAGN